MLPPPPPFWRRRQNGLHFMPLVKAEKSRVIVLFDWKDMVHDRTTADACYQTSNVTMKYKTSIVVLLVMVHQCMHCHFPLVTSIMRLILKRPWLPASANQNQTRESQMSRVSSCVAGAYLMVFCFPRGVR